MKKWSIFILIVLIAALLRFVHLGANPPSLDWDEAAWGYNAYTLGIDGRDEFGVLLPYKYLESFGDFKPPLYAYLDILPIKMLGLNEYATRFPSAFFGTLTVLITYFLVKRIFNQSNQKEWYAFTSAGILAISPWHINLSRAAFEANVATFLIVLGVWLFLEGVAKRPWLLVPSVISFSLSFYTFNTTRVVAPILGIVLALVFYRQLFKKLIPTIVAAIFALVLLLPLVTFLLSPQAKLRYQEVNIFSDVSLVQTANQEVTNDHNALWSKVLHNRRIVYADEYLKHYFDNLNPLFLFIKGDVNRRFSTQDVGEMYIWEAVTLVAGLLFLFRKREGEWWLLPVWLLIGIIPAATARETPHALRIESSLPTFQILSAYGTVNLLSYWRKIIHNRKIRYELSIIGICIVLIPFLIYIHGYYTHYPKEAAADWQYGYKDVVSYVRQVEPAYDRVVMTEALGRPYIYFAFYLGIPPDAFRQSAVVSRDTFGFAHVQRLGKFIFSDDFSHQATANTLFIGTPSELPKNAKIVKRFYLPDGTEQLDAFVNQ